ncbi:hypothetical protein [Aquiflexum lacus]|uniref:hypothetical protein n=1 Tax=Aquiflexum lacus TaxID=2483805 RepID=UPI0018939AC6|nr:hypothetical protein [Aquiflexum lacus]
MEGIALHTLLNKVLLDDKEEDLGEFLSQFKFSHCLVVGDGYSIELLYSNKHMLVYYYHRQRKEAYISILGIVDWKIEMMRFLARIYQIYRIDVFELEERILNEVEQVYNEQELI